MKDYFKCETGTWKYIPNWIRNIKHNFKWIKWCKQRAFRGWADCDCWSVDGYLAIIIPDMISQLRESAHGVPVDKDGEPLTEEMWDGILEKIQLGFEAAQRIQGFNGEISDYKLDNEIFEEGMTLFKEYYFNLWD